MRERVFDTSLYKDLPEQVRTPVITEDLAGLVLEAGKNLPLEYRINPRKLVIIGEDVLDPIEESSVLKSLSEESEFDLRETASARSFYRNLIFCPVGSSVFSVSAPGGEAGYLEGRVNVALRVSDEEIEFYGIPTRLSAEALLNKAILLNEHSQANVVFSDPEDLRETSIPVVIPPGKNPWVFLNEVFPLDSEAWSVIRRGKPWIMKEKAKFDSHPVEEETSKQIGEAKTPLDYLYAGAKAERKMEMAGWVLNYSGCPGLFNSQILGMQRVGIAPFVIDVFGNVRSFEKKYIKNCGKCGVHIGKPISSGYHCPSCGGTYEGC